jgi:IS605 OrfB family transposase
LELTLTAKIRIQPDQREQALLVETLKAVKAGSNFVSDQVFQSHILSRTKLIKLTYATLRTEFQLRSQMSQSIAIAVLAKYKSAKSNGHEWSRIRFKKPEYDLVFNRDYSLRSKGVFSINTLEGRIQVAYEMKGMEHFFDGTWKFGTAKLVFKKQNYFLHVPMTKTLPEIDLNDIHNVVGVDLGINFLAFSYNSEQMTAFFKGRRIKDQRAHYKRIRTSLQQKQTPSARRRLKQIGPRENRWMTDVNHQVSKALVEQAGRNSLIVLEELKGVHSATERVRKGDRWMTVSWAFHQLRQMIEYKAKLNQVAVIAVDPAYTSQCCPKCEHTAKVNRNKMLHRFTCQRCGYTSNDDRIGAMNLQRKGIEYLAAVTASA